MTNERSSDETNDDQPGLGCIGVVMRASAVCGNCGKRWDKHHHEDEAYCNMVTNGDVFTEEPRDDTIMAWIREKHPSFVDDEIFAWKRANGHA